MHLAILGRRWRLKYPRTLPKDVLGLCADPNEPNKFIAIHSQLDGLERLRTELHEIMHAADWSKDEAWVEQFAKDAAMALWRIGYRCKS